MFWNPISNEMLLVFQIVMMAGFTIGMLAYGKEALISTICMFGVLSNLLITKQITLFGFNIITTDVFAVGSIFGLSLLQEYYGLPIAKKSIVINFIILLFYLATSQLFLLYVPNAFDTMQQHFAIIFSPMPRIIIASVIVYMCSQVLTTYLHTFFSQRWTNKYLVLRNVAVVFLAQLFDTVAFSFAALYGIVHSVWHIIIISMSIKMLVIIGSTPFISFCRRYIKPPYNK
jgi:queuosine precursor transporter